MKQLCVITLTRIFLLSHKYPDLVREITTPVLSDFLAASLDAASSVKKAEAEGRRAAITTIEIVIQALISLIGLHPNQFRPFLRQIKAFLGPCVTATLHDGVHDVSPKPLSTSSYARQLLVLLSVCEPSKNTEAAWAESIHAVIEAFHHTADLVLRSFIEDWTPNSHTAQKRSPANRSFNESLCDQSGRFAFPAWNGASAGVHRLIELLHLIEAFMTTKTSMAVKAPFGDISDAIDRLLLAVATETDRQRRWRPEADRGEREMLLVNLPVLHIVALQVYTSMIKTFGFSLVPAVSHLTTKCLWIFEYEGYNPDVRATCYALLYESLPLTGPSMTKGDVEQLVPLFRACCGDLLKSESSRSDPHTQESLSDVHHISVPQKGCGLSASIFKPQIPQYVRLAARKLLPLILRLVPPEHLNSNARSQIDSATVLSQDEDGLLASILNVPEAQGNHKAVPSILPFLARQCTESSGLEALVRPQMPVILSESTNSENFFDPPNRDSDARARTAFDDTSERWNKTFSFQQSTEAEYSDPATVQDSAIQSPDLTDLKEVSISREEPPPRKRVRMESEEGVQATPPVQNAIEDSTVREQRSGWSQGPALGDALIKDKSMPKQGTNDTDDDDSDLPDMDIGNMTESSSNDDEVN